jgi:aerobic-type carbon monoxide dehydrogenase small subunit (CoxS/CutS family)
MSEEKVNKISRREFLKDAGLVVGGATIGSMAMMGACSGETATTTITKTATTTATKTLSGSISTTTVTSPPITEVVEVSSDVSNINIIVNGKPYEIQVEANWTLRDVLRQKLGLTSIKDMCGGYGACGSCSVIMDGRPILSCLALAVNCDGAVIETAEHITDSNHPLIEKYIMNYCAQCGYCIPGFIVTAKALLDHNTNPTENDIKEAFGGNICRCGTYPVHITAVLEAAAELRAGG